ncbi:hypothetical protein COV18_02535 [Candidatus Woesearchaeota archaeon CG10_big_fil_rev_8_21_14_0_10_37_12]|nr:MAG: hypothetical protein COV18_02535 [Candidatus Woesearchaeota archaeon CG10_big_fil_rev_8_21_14_0_10_37_12]
MDNANILIVDDDVEVLRLLKELLGRKVSSAIIATASNADAAQIAYRNNKDSLRVVVLDTEIGRTRGYELLDDLKQQGYAGKAVGLSGNTDSEHENNWSERGAVFLAKPPDTNRLTGYINDALKNN